MMSEGSRFGMVLRVEINHDSECRLGSYRFGASSPNVIEPPVGLFPLSYFMLLFIRTFVKHSEVYPNGK